MLKWVLCAEKASLRQVSMVLDLCKSFGVRREMVGGDLCRPERELFVKRSRLPSCLDSRSPVTEA